jgi:signal recognition particle receptor subunit alpha
LFFEHHCNNPATSSRSSEYNIQLFVPPSEEFDTAFSSILRRFQDQLSSTIPTSTSTSSLEKKQANNNRHNKQLQQQQAQTITKKGGKKATQWHDGNQKITKAALDELDMSKDKEYESSAADGDGIIREDTRAIAEAKAAYMPNKDEVPAWEEEDEILDELNFNWNNRDESNQEDDDDDSQSNTGIRGFFSNLLSPNRPLTKSDLEPPLKQMQQLLTSKNVAPSTAHAICEVVERQLLGKKVGTLVGVKRAVRHALEDAIERILRPDLGGIGGRGSGVKSGNRVDVLRGVVEKREKRTGLLGMGGGSGGGGGRPYVIVMIGINGVGKSTSLAKIAYYLQSNQCKPLLAACDTFRSGAVEQLSVHASCLSLPLYHQGYAKDPSAVAKAAINKASEDGNDVVLVDTAGEFHNCLQYVFLYILCNRC